jgi:hypothetical protein
VVAVLSWVASAAALLAAGVVVAGVVVVLLLLLLPQAVRPAIMTSAKDRAVSLFFIAMVPPLI